MRYAIIRGYLQDRIDFCDEFKMQRDASKLLFSFNELSELRRQESLEWSNGIVRSIFGCEIGKYEKGIISDGKWKQRYAVITNIGIFVFKENS